MRHRYSCIILIFFLFSGSIMISQEEKGVLNNSSIAFTIPEKDLLPESIAYDSLKNEFYIGSTRKGKIIKVSKDGSKKVFITPKKEGLWMIIGMEIDSKRRHLWVCSSGGDNLEGYTLKDDKEGRPAGVFKFDLNTGKLINKYILDIPGEIHFFNDIVINKNGDAYITHMFSEHALYTIPKEQDQLTKVFSSTTIKYPNGITFSGDESQIFIAHAEGVSVYNIKNRKTLALEVPEHIKISKRESIDGLYYYKNSLIGIQPDSKTVQQFKLNKTGSKILSAKPLEVNHPMMNNPTTGEIIKDKFYYVANAQFGSFNKDGSLFSSDKLYEVCILKLPLQHHQSKNEHYE
ncbi:SMP-30/gluconolactonase/LRE family protein [Aquimarina sp. AU474]|uniref:SMP-30/gluconolactonase/LRE family protein n=1 Tax=Aquimarina sp. AU474 TaxID=2108529 RepID=UPI000D6932BE|nr:SMP-30/gluconolactonase/LRE family protein [Aquimarina sp. AU474]